MVVGLGGGRGNRLALFDKALSSGAPFGRPRYQSDPSSVAKCERGDAVGAIIPYQARLRFRVQPVL